MSRSIRGREEREGCDFSPANPLPVGLCVRPAAWLLIPLLSLVLVPRWAAPGAAGGARPALVRVAGGATEDATASNNQVKVVRAPAGLVAAYAGTDAGGAQVFLALSRDNGASWSVLTRVSSGSVPSRLATLALDGSGRLHVIWTRYDDDVGKIYYRVWTGQWTGPQARISPPSGYAGYPALALDRSGHPQVVWYGIRTGAPAAQTRHQSIYEIYHVGFDGQHWSPPRLISAGLPDAINPAMAAGGDGRLHAVWYQYDGRSYQIRYAERDRDWSPPAGVVRTRADEFNPDVAVDAKGRVSIVWEHHDGSRSLIEYARRAGGRWDEPVALSDGVSPARHPSLAVTASGEPYVVWDQDDGRIYLRRRVAGRWEPVARLTADGGNSFPSASADGSRVGAIWTHTVPGGSAVYFARVSP